MLLIIRYWHRGNAEVADVAPSRWRCPRRDRPRFGAVSALCLGEAESRSGCPDPERGEVSSRAPADGWVTYQVMILEDRAGETELLLKKNTGLYTMF